MGACTHSRPIPMTRHRRLSTCVPRSVPALLVAAALIGVSGCGGTTTVAFNHLPGNVMAHPFGRAEIISSAASPEVATALRALGIPAHVVPFDSVDDIGARPDPFVVVAEHALDDQRLLGSLPIVLESVRRGGTVLMLVQSPESLHLLRARYGNIAEPKVVDHSLQLVRPRREIPPMAAMDRPNEVRNSDLDSLALGARQVVVLSGDARAVIAASLLSPDSSAVLTWQPFGHGQLWYLAAPVSARAASGYGAEQRLLANLMSYATGPTP